MPLPKRFWLVLMALAGVLPGPRTAVSAPGVETPLPPPGFAVVKERSDLGRPARRTGRPYAGPIVDTHVHLMNRAADGLHGILARMDRAGVERLILLPTPNEAIFRDRNDNARDRRRFLELAGGRGGRLCGSTYLTRWMDGAYRRGYDEADLQTRLRRLADDLDGGTCLGIGEIGATHFEKKPGMAVIEFRLDFQPMLALAALAAEKGVWLDLHAEPVTPDGRSVEDDLFGGIALMFHRFPKLKLILSHTGMTNPANARALLDLYPGLMMNLKMVRPGRRLSWDHLEPISNADDALYEDWARLMEDQPERFMIGSDSRFGTRQYLGKRYGRNIRKLRRILGSLEPRAADRIAHGNARRVFGRMAAGKTALKSPEPGADRARRKRSKRRRR